MFTKLFRSLSRKKNNPKGEPALAPFLSLEESQKVTDQFWKETTSTFLHNSAYYERVEHTLKEEVLPLVRTSDKILDVGCGNGFFTLLFSSLAEDVLGIDFSSKLINEAQKKSDIQKIKNTRFEVGEVADLPKAQGYDIVSCMGTLVCTIEDAAFEEQLKALADAVLPSGYLLLRESLSERAEPILQHTGFMWGRYRTRSQYFDLLSKKGFAVMKEYTLDFWETEKTVNKLMLFKKKEQTHKASNAKYQLI